MKFKTPATVSVKGSCPRDSSEAHVVRARCVGYTTEGPVWGRFAEHLPSFRHTHANRT